VFGDLSELLKQSLQSLQLGLSAEMLQVQMLDAKLAAQDRDQTRLLIESMSKNVTDSVKASTDVILQSLEQQNVEQRRALDDAKAHLLASMREEFEKLKAQQQQQRDRSTTADSSTTSFPEIKMQDLTICIADAQHAIANDSSGSVVSAIWYFESHVAW
jgi:hypothetical protein